MVRAIEVGAIAGTKSPATKLFTTAVDRSTRPVPPASATSMASTGAQALRILHSFFPPPAVLWCIGQYWPGWSPSQQSCSSAGTSLQQNAIGAAAKPATWHVSHMQTSHDSRRRTNSKATLSLSWALYL